MIPGVTIQMGGNEWTVPPLTLGQLRKLEGKIRSMINIGADGLGITEEQADTIAEVVAAALSRNYPDMTTDKVLNLIDLGNARQVINAVMGGSGLRPGEVEAVARGNGATSMDSSPPPADIAIQ